VRLDHGGWARQDGGVLQLPLDWLYRRLGRRYLRLTLFGQLQLAHVVVLGGVALLTLFVDVSAREFGLILAVAQGLVLLENLAAYVVLSRLVRPADPWLRGDRSPEAAGRAWRAVAGLPRDYVRHRRWLVAVAFNIVPISAYVIAELGLAWWPGFPIMVLGSAVVLLYGVLLRFFAFELIARPVLERVSRDVPADADLGRVTVGLRARLLLALPAMNVIGGVVVSGLSSPERSLEGLGLGVAVAIGVAFTISLELTLLLSNSVVGPLRSLRRGTDAVAAGDLSARVPVLGSDEAGRLASSFNTMVAGLQEREQLREAFGAYVAPEVAVRVLAEGTQLAGEEVEVSVLFVDIRDFTAFAERASAREVVGQLNGFYERVVPVLTRQGGHANKFVGDGLLAVFGAPDRLEDHADRAVAAAIELARLVREEYHGELRVGVGVNSGPVVAGTIGGGGRVDFTVIGDAVNTAARVEAVTRLTNDDVLVTEATRCRLRRDHGGFVERPTVELKGKREPVRLHAPLLSAAAASVAVATAHATRS